MNTQDLKRQLTAILTSDVEGYSCLMRENEEVTIRTLTIYRTAMTQIIDSTAVESRIPLGTTS